MNNLETDNSETVNPTKVESSIKYSADGEPLVLGNEVYFTPGPRSRYYTKGKIVKIEEKFIVTEDVNGKKRQKFPGACYYHKPEG